MSLSQLHSKLGEAEDAGCTGYARHLCDKILSEQPGHGPTLLRLADTLVAFRCYADAEDALDQAEEIAGPEWIHLVIAQRGHLEESRGNFKKGLDHFLQAHRLDPDDATYLVYAGVVAFRMGDIKQAITLLEQATACPEGSVDEAYFNLGGCLFSEMRYEEAKKCYLKAIEIDPAYKIARDNLDDINLILAHPGE